VQLSADVAGEFMIIALVFYFAAARGVKADAPQWKQDLATILPVDAPQLQQQSQRQRRLQQHEKAVGGEEEEQLLHDSETVETIFDMSSGWAVDVLGDDDDALVEEEVGLFIHSPLVT